MYFQVAFLIRDQYGKVLVVNRRAKKHFLLRKHSCLVSLSPIPNCFGESFDAYSLFCRRVASSEYHKIHIEHRFNLRIVRNSTNYCFFIYEVSSSDCNLFNKPIPDELFISGNSSFPSILREKYRDDIVGWKEVKELIENKENFDGDVDRVVIEWLLDRNQNNT